MGFIKGSYVLLINSNLRTFNIQVFLEYADIASSARAKAALNGRRFANNLVVAVYFPEDKFATGDYDFDVGHASQQTVA